MVNGAGLAMGTMDMIQLAGGRPANFLDVGGGATGEGRGGVQDPARRPRSPGVLVNIFGGIMKCDVIAKGILAAQQVGLSVPLVVRLEGTNVEMGKALLAQASSRSSPRTTSPTRHTRRSPPLGRRPGRRDSTRRRRRFALRRTGGTP